MAFGEHRPPGHVEINRKAERYDVDEFLGEEKEHYQSKTAVHVMIGEFADESVISFPFQQLTFHVNANGSWLLFTLHFFDLQLNDGRHHPAEAGEQDDDARYTEFSDNASYTCQFAEDVLVQT